MVPWQWREPLINSKVNPYVAGVLQLFWLPSVPHGVPAEERWNANFTI